MSLMDRKPKVDKLDKLIGHMLNMENLMWICSEVAEKEKLFTKKGVWIG